MKRPARIWIVLLIVAMVTTVSSVAVWYAFTRAGTASEVQYTMAAHDTMKVRLVDLKGSRDFLTPRIVEGADERVITYYDENNNPVIVESWGRQGDNSTGGYVLTTVRYDLDRDGKTDVSESYDSEGQKIIRTEYDTDQDDATEVIENDLNGNSLSEAEETYIFTEGGFVPISGFGNLII